MEIERGDILIDPEMPPDLRATSYFDWMRARFFYPLEACRAAIYPPAHRKKSACKRGDGVEVNKEILYRLLIDKVVMDRRQQTITALQETMTTSRHHLEQFDPRFFLRDATTAAIYRHEYRLLYLQGREDQDLENAAVARFMHEHYLSDAEVMAEFWGQHNITYLERLDHLSQQVDLGDRERLQCIIAIPARNERHIKRTIETIRQSYGEGFDQEVLVVIYHNYTENETIPDDVAASVAEVRAYPNVVVIEDAVPRWTNTGMAKKIVSDLVLRSLGNRLDIPLLMMDADIVGLTPGTIRAAIAALDKPYVMAASPEFDFDPAIKSRYPVLGKFWDIRRDLDLTETREEVYGHQLTYGMMYGVRPRTLALVGGIKPLEQYEDVQLTSDLRSCALRDDTYKRHLLHTPPVEYYPVYPLGIDGYIVETDAQHEIRSLLRGEPLHVRWLQPAYHNDEEPRPEEPEATLPDIPEFGKLNEANLAHALNEETFILPVHWNSLAAYRHYRRLIRVLVDHGIRIVEADVRFGKTRLTGTAGGDYLAKHAQRGRFIIWRIQKIAFAG
jgi:hypothetical protein